MNCRLELDQVKYKNNVQMKIAAHCAQVFAGVKPSNTVTLDREDTSTLIQSLKGTKIRCSLIYAGVKRCVWLLYREQELRQYLMKTEHQKFIKTCGYPSVQLNDIFITLQKNYEKYKRGEKGFPHELGLILGYPLCDVEGFIRYQGHGYLFSGYWKVYGNAQYTRKLFEVYDLVRYQIIKQVQCKKSLAHIDASYSNYKIPKTILKTAGTSAVPAVLI
ncbi:DUF3793 family protein [Anaerostipes sp.]|uniref:DUF3793 family protein n=1 Tax=Anaerostipes sp. TaxID=1872530 RepID=UPI0025C220E4|nr:DUF3793 family protein [Anaerostipes sp.]MBS7008789.1 DUF3793 family protein [Anaerostipes sp.]